MDGGSWSYTFTNLPHHTHSLAWFTLLYYVLLYISYRAETSVMSLHTRAVWTGASVWQKTSAMETDGPWQKTSDLLNSQALFMSTVTYAYDTICKWIVCYYTNALFQIFHKINFIICGYNITVCSILYPHVRDVAPRGGAMHRGRGNCEHTPAVATVAANLIIPSICVSYTAMWFYFGSNDRTLLCQILLKSSCTVSSTKHRWIC